MAADAGAWGNNLQVEVDYDNLDVNLVKQWNLTQQDLFNLSVRDLVTGRVEQFFNLTVQDSIWRIDKVLSNESNLLRVDLTKGDENSNVFRLKDKTKRIVPQITVLSKGENWKEPMNSVSTYTDTLIKSCNEKIQEYNNVTPRPATAIKLKCKPLILVN
jgi:hypothetical protein